MYFQVRFLAVFIVFHHKICVFMLTYAQNTAYFLRGENVSETVYQRVCEKYFSKTF